MKKFALMLAVFAALMTPVATQAAHIGPRAHRDEPTPPPPPPLNFAVELANFISYSDDVAALRSWYETLSPAEQESYAGDFNKAVETLAAKENTLFDLVDTQLTAGESDANLYLLFETIKGMDPIKARKVFTGLINKASQRVNHDYVNNPSDPSCARRARDAQAVRSYIGHQG